MALTRRVLTLVCATAITLGPPEWCSPALAQSPEMRGSLRRTSELRQAFRARQHASARRDLRAIQQMQEQEMLMMRQLIEWQASQLQNMQSAVWNHYSNCGSLVSAYTGDG